MKLWYFTFGVNSKLGNNVQPILANSYGEAREKMFKKYDSNWAFQYSEEEWEELKEQPNLGLEEELEVIK